jgi:chemotaxis protein CheD
VIAAASGPGAPASSSAQRIFLHWGQIAVAGAGAQLTTIVGSCIAVCLWAPGRRLGGMNHYLLPKAPPGGDRLAKPWSYGELAMPELLARMVAAGASPPDITARVFGGAAITQHDLAGPGAGNAALACEWLGAHRIPIVTREVGGRRGRKVLFEVDSGASTVSLL